MENKKKAVAKPVAGLTMIEESKLKVLNVSTIEDAQVIEIEEPKKSAPNLEQTIEIVGRLFKANQHRNKIIHYTDVLEKFDVNQREEELKDAGYYSGCKMVLTDDKQTSFELRNPTLIREVVEFLKTKFINKLGEIEAEIVLPI